MQLKKQLFSLVFLTLLFFKVFAAGMLLHIDHGNDHEENVTCELCEDALYNQLLAFTTAVEALGLPVDFKVDFLDKSTAYTTQFVLETSFTPTFARPPPALM